MYPKDPYNRSYYATIYLGAKNPNVKSYSDFLEDFDYVGRRVVAFKGIGSGDTMCESGRYHDAQLLNITIPITTKVVTNIEGLASGRECKPALKDFYKSLDSDVTEKSNSLMFHLANLPEVRQESFLDGAIESVNNSPNFLHFDDVYNIMSGSITGVCGQALYSGKSIVPIVFYIKHEYIELSKCIYEIDNYFIPVVLSTGTIIYSEILDDGSDDFWKKLLSKWSRNSEGVPPMLGTLERKLEYLDSLDIFTMCDVKLAEDLKKGK